MPETNPYNDKSLIINYKEGDKSLQRDKVKYIASPSDRFHVVKEDDNLSIISYKYYKSARYWWLIADANGSIENPFILNIGETLIIPDIKLIDQV